MFNQIKQALLEAAVEVQARTEELSALTKFDGDDDKDDDDDRRLL